MSTKVQEMPETAKLEYARQCIAAAETCALNDDFAGALKEYREYLRVFRGRADAWSNVGCCLISLGRTHSAMRCFRAACQFEKHEVHYSYLAYCMQCLGRIKQAIRFYKVALEINPEHRDSLNNLLMLYLGDRRRRKQTPAVAKQLLNLLEAGSDEYGRVIRELQAHGIRSKLSLVDNKKQRHSR